MDAFQPLVELLDAAAYLVWEHVIPQEEEQWLEADGRLMLHIATASRLPPLVSLELAQVKDVSGIIHGVLELCCPSLHALVGDAPPLGVSEEGFVDNPSLAQLIYLFSAIFRIRCA